MFKVNDVAVGKDDSAGRRITQVYALRSDLYAVYKAGEVLIQFADDPATATKQMQDVRSVGPIRAEVNDLLASCANHDAIDHKMAFAFKAALEGDVESAKAAMLGAKLDLVAGQDSRMRFVYLKWTAISAACFLALLFVASHFYRFPDVSSNVWLAAKAGLAGAAFSIAIGMRNKSVPLVSRPLDNASDAVLRLGIGVIAASMLLLLLTSGYLAAAPVNDIKITQHPTSWQAVMVIGFVAGFLERLVPDLLSKAHT